MTGDAIAVVGMAALFPAAPDAATFWSNIVSGRDAISEVPSGRWDPEYYDPGHAGAERFYCRRGGFVDDIATFDPASFGIMPVAVDHADPDQLLTLRVAAAALDDAGGADRLIADPRRVGVILGRGGYYNAGVVRLDQRVRVAEQVVATLREVVPGLAETEVERVRAAFRGELGPEHPEAMIGLVPNLAASRIANRLDLQGPAYTVDAACASSLVAVDQAVHELRTGRCDVMVAGGTHHCHDVTFWSVFTQLGALSRTEHIRPFDRRADGLLIGEGTGIMVLERLEDALVRGDRVYAVIRGVGVASDGRDTSLMKPKVSGQLLALERAWTDAGLDPDTVGLVEAHGTATPMGDRTELETLATFFGQARGSAADDPNEPSRAGLGSVKSMIGHAMPAAGAAGMIKTVLALHHQLLPPTIHCEEPSRGVTNTRFRVLHEAEPWERGAHPRRAAVNAFGFGGTNAHVVLEEAPDAAVRAPVVPAPAGSSRARGARGERLVVHGPGGGPSPHAPRDRVLLFAGDTKADVLAQLGSDADDAALLERNDLVSGPPGDGPVRLALVAANAKRLALARRVVDQGTAWRGRNDIWFTPDGLLARGSGGKLAFLFPGVEPTFEPKVDDVAAFLGEPAPDIESGGIIGFQAAAIVTVGRMVNRALGRCDVRPDAIAGHSIGELTAGVEAGMTSPEAFDAFIEGIDLARVALPDTLFAALACGVEVAEEAIADLPEVVVSHDNCPHQSIICGEEAAVREALARLRARNVLCQEIPFRSGFHSPMFAPYLEPMMELIADLPSLPQQIPMYSATICGRYPSSDAEVRALGARHLVERVRFRELVQCLYGEGVRGFVQVGTGSLTSFVDDTLRGEQFLCLEAASAKRPGMEQLLRVLAGLWVEGRDGMSFEALGSAPATAAAPVSNGGSPLRLGAPLIRLGDRVQLALPGVAAVAGVVDVPTAPAVDAAAFGLDDDDPLLAEMAAVMAEAAEATRAVLSASQAFLADGGRAPAAPAPASVSAPAPASPPPPTRPHAGAPGGPSTRPPARHDRPRPADRHAPAAPVAAGPPAAVPTPPAGGPPPSEPRSLPEPTSRELEVSLSTMPWLVDHSFFWERHDWPVMADRFPVVPMTNIVELVGEEGERLYPGRIATAVHSMRALRWTTAEPPMTVALRATPVEGGQARVVLEGYARGTVVLSDAYPQAPAADLRPLRNERSTPHTAEEMYAERWMFHGPGYQSVVELSGFGDDGIRGVLECRDAPGSLLDGAGQICGYWVNNTVTENRLALPSTFRSLTYYGPHPGLGERLTCTVRVVELTDDRVVADIELRRGTALWCRIEGWEERRFSTNGSLFQSIMFPEWTLVGEQRRGAFELVQEVSADAATRELLMRNYTTETERETYANLNPRQQRHWILGRIAVKDAVRRTLGVEGVVPEGATRPGDPSDDFALGIFPAEVVVGNDGAGAPVVTSAVAGASDLKVSLAHTDWMAVAIAGRGGPVGIDVERVEPRPSRFSDLALQPDEHRFVPGDGPGRDLALTRLWTVKEAAAKAAGTGFEGNPRRFVVEQVDGDRHLVAGRWIDTEIVSNEEGTYVVAWTID